VGFYQLTSSACWERSSDSSCSRTRSDHDHRSTATSQLDSGCSISLSTERRERLALHSMPVQVYSSSTGDQSESETAGTSISYCAASCTQTDMDPVHCPAYLTDATWLWSLVHIISYKVQLVYNHALLEDIGAEYDSADCRMLLKIHSSGRSLLSMHGHTIILYSSL